MTLRAHNLACTRGGVPILRGVDLNVPSGSALILKGPNGVGKTTLLRTLAGLQPALEGQIECDGEGIAYAGHAEGIKAQLSVQENLHFWAKVYGKTVPDNIYTLFDLQDLKYRPAGTLSAGQKRRLGLARPGVIGCHALLLDEPTVSLDAASVKLFAGFVQRHLDSGGVAVIATHIDLGLSAPDCNLTAFRAAFDDLAASDGAFL